MSLLLHQHTKTQRELTHARTERDLIHARTECNLSHEHVLSHAGCFEVTLELILEIRGENEQYCL